MKTYAYGISTQAQSSTDYKTKTIQFGNGFAQRTNTSAGPVLKNWQVSRKHKRAVIDSIEAFLDEHQGTKAFLWRPTKHDSYQKYIAKDVSRVHIRGDIWQINWIMEQVIA